MKKRFLKVITDIALEDINKAAIENESYSFLRNKYNQMFDAIKASLNEETTEFLYELDEAMQDMRMMTEEAAYLKGLADGKELTEALTEILV